MYRGAVPRRGISPLFLAASLECAVDPLNVSKMRVGEISGSLQVLSGLEGFLEHVDERLGLSHALLPELLGPDVESQLLA